MNSYINHIIQNLYENTSIRKVLVIMFIKIPEITVAYICLYEYLHNWLEL